VLIEPALCLPVDDEVEPRGRGKHRHQSEYGPPAPDQASREQGRQQWTRSVATIASGPNPRTITIAHHGVQLSHQSSYRGDGLRRSEGRIDGAEQHDRNRRSNWR
jgi:hypothetical protein